MTKGPKGSSILIYDGDYLMEADFDYPDTPVDDIDDLNKALTKAGMNVVVVRER